MLQRYNPLLQEFSNDGRIVRETIFELARRKVQQYGGVSPEYFTFSPVRETGKYPDIENRVMVGWKVPLSEEKVHALEHYLSQLYPDGRVYHRKDPFGATRAIESYRAPNAKVKKDIRGYLFSDRQDGFATGLWVSRLFSSAAEAKRVPSHSQRWLYQGQGFIEMRDQPRCSYLDFLEHTVQISRILAGEECTKTSPLLYDLYRSTVPSSVEPTSERQVAGLQEVLEFIRWTVFGASLNPSVARKYGVREQSVLVASVPGLGKTTLAKILALEDLGSLFVPIEATTLLELASDKKGEGHSIFEGVRELRSRTEVPIVLYCDDVETVMKDVALDGHSHPASVSSLLNKLQGVWSDGIRLCGATNYPMGLDPRFLQFGRIGYLLHLPLPNAALRQEVFTIHTASKPLHSDVSFAELVDQTDGFTPREIEEVCNVAAVQAMKRLAGSHQHPEEPLSAALRRCREEDPNNFPITDADFRRGVAQVRSHVDVAATKRLDVEIRDFCRRYAPPIGFI